MNPVSLEQSHAHCHALTHRSGSNFVYSFWLLPRPQRRAMRALYAFMRQTDDLADESGTIDEKRTRLQSWRHALDASLDGDYRDRIFPALAQVVRSRGIPPRYLHDVIDGVEMDLEPEPFPTFDALYRYCYRVASAVGLACIHVWGFRGDRAPALAESVGIGFQLTNILRDLAEDRANGRVYLPMEDLDRFGARPEAWPSESFRELMRFEVQRARGYYEQGAPLADLLEPPGRAVFRLMWRTYRGLLDAIEARDYDVFTERVRLTSWQKLRLFAGAVPDRMGW